LKKLLGEISYKPSVDDESPSIGGLENEKISILKLLAKSEESGREEMLDSEIARATELSLTLTRYHLEALAEKDYIYVGYAVGQPALYSINQQGRKFLIENQLI